MLIIRTLQYVAFFKIPFLRFVENSSLYDSFDLDFFRNVSYELKNLFDIGSFILLLWGMMIAAKNKSIRITTPISIFIYYSFTSLLFYLITLFSSSNIEFNVNPFMIFNLIFFTSTIVYYGFENRNSVVVDGSNIASKQVRFLNYTIDTFIFSVVFIKTVFSHYVNGYPNFDYLSIINAHIVYLYIIFRFFYYFTNEFLFHATLGKLCTNSSVTFTSRFKDILIRTFCRFIPFEILSFLLKKKGMHDVFSNTDVVKV